MRPLQGIHLLVVDDDHDTMDLYDFYLRDQGATVTTARSSAEARLALSTQTPQVVVSDVRLPDEDGYSLVASMRALPSTARIPAIAVTGQAGAAARARALAAGFDRHIAKPVDLADMTRSILELVGRSPG